MKILVTHLLNFKEHSHTKNPTYGTYETPKEFGICAGSYSGSLSVVGRRNVHYTPCEKNPFQRC